VLPLHLPLTAARQSRLWFSVLYHVRL